MSDALQINTWVIFFTDMQTSGVRIKEETLLSITLSYTLTKLSDNILTPKVFTSLSPSKDFFQILIFILRFLSYTHSWILLGLPQQTYWRLMKLALRKRKHGHIEVSLASFKTMISPLIQWSWANTVTVNNPV